MKTKEILNKVAEANGVSVKEVYEEIQKAIDDAWQNPPNDGGVTVAYQQKVPCKGKVPTPEELIHYMVREIKRST